MVMVIIQIAFGGINIATNDGMSVKIMVACRFHGSPCSNSRMLKTRPLAILTRLNQRMTRGVRTREHSSDSLHLGTARPRQSELGLAPQRSLLWCPIHRIQFQAQKWVLERRIFHLVWE
ncbi:hypothetical protein VitviT2T_005780 [Vitis vinifera]|uniref:Uncharacterized protein n=1 Tax=Vitis vinifera TaxID=29760 RepID=A0ABY9BTU8_VITVI|nr:hypothetical protein VitviT2T_005780 [Vitis vinifera]